MHDRRLVHLDDGFWGRRAIAQCTVRSLGIIVAPPFFDDDLGFAQRVEDLAVQQLVAEPAVEALTIAVLPGAARFDKCGLGAHGIDPFPDGLGDELGPIIRSDERRYTTHNEEIGQSVDHIDRVQLAPDADRQAFTCVLVQDVERPECPAVVGPTVNEVIAPNMVSVLWPEADA